MLKITFVPAGDVFWFGFQCLGAFIGNEAQSVCPPGKLFLPLPAVFLVSFL